MLICRKHSNLLTLIIVQISLQEPYLPIENVTHQDQYINIDERHTNSGYGSVHTVFGNPYLALPHDPLFGQPIRHINIDNKAGDCITKVCDVLA